jgi:hypothetical protein
MNTTIICNSIHLALVHQNKSNNRLIKEAILILESHPWNIMSKLEWARNYCTSIAVRYNECHRAHFLWMNLQKTSTWMGSIKNTKTEANKTIDHQALFSWIYKLNLFVLNPGKTNSKLISITRYSILPERSRRDKLLRNT